MNHLKNNYKKYLLLLLVIASMIVGGLIRPTIIKTYKAVYNFLNPDPVYYEAEKVKTAEEERQDRVSDMLKTEPLKNLCRKQAEYWVMLDEGVQLEQERSILDAKRGSLNDEVIKTEKDIEIRKNEIFDNKVKPLTSVKEEAKIILGVKK